MLGLYAVPRCFRRPDPESSREVVGAGERLRVPGDGRCSAGQARPNRLAPTGARVVCSRHRDSGLRSVGSRSRRRRAGTRRPARRCVEHRPGMRSAVRRLAAAPRVRLAAVRRRPDGDDPRRRDRRHGRRQPVRVRRVDPRCRDHRHGGALDRRRFARVGSGGQLDSSPSPRSGSASIHQLTSSSAASRP